MASPQPLLHPKGMRNGGRSAMPSHPAPRCRRQKCCDGATEGLRLVTVDYGTHRQPTLCCPDCAAAA